MKKSILHILRSTITSFLFMILIPTIFLQILLTTIQINKISIPKDIDLNVIKSKLNIENIEQPTTQQIDDFLNNYIKYLFKGGSYPNTNLKENNFKINEISNQINIEYNEVLTIRKVFILLFNNSTYLIVNFLIFVIFLSIIIIWQNFISGIKKFFFYITISSLISLFIFLSLYTYIKNSSTFLSYLILNVLDNYYFRSIINISLIYIGTFFILYLIFKFLIIKSTKNYKNS